MKPLEGVKVVDLSTVIAASSTARIMAEQGAEVIKVEPPEGDLHRVQGAILGVPVVPGENPVFDVVNANKRFIALDLKSEDGRTVLLELIRNADVLITNHREDALKRLGIAYDDLKTEFPGLVYGHINAYGERGPDAAKPGYDIIAYFARTGIALDTGTAENFPLVNLAGMGDHPTGVALAQGISAALYKKLRTGEGDKVSVSLYHTGIWTAATIQTGTQYGHSYPKPYAEPVLLPVMGHPYKTADGEWIFFVLFDFDKYWAPLCESLDRPDLVTDERFNSRLANKKNQTAMVEILAPLIESKTLAEWSERWCALDIPFECLKHMGDIAHDEQAIANDFIRPVEYPSGKTVQMPMSPMQFRNSELGEFVRSESVGAHTRELLIELGYDGDSISSMIAEGIVRAAD